MLIYPIVYLLAGLVALLAVPLVIKVAMAIRIVDRPGIRKIHTERIARIGGVAILIGIMVAMVPVLFFHTLPVEQQTSSYTRLGVVLACSTLIFFVGLADDIFGLRARVKLLAQIGAAAIVCASGIRIEFIGIETMSLAYWSWPLTILWIVGITNAVNLIDGLDGLAAGLSAIACGVIAILAFHSGQHMMAALMLAALGSLTGFLFFNFNPAKVFLGDCGSMFLGFFLATASVLSYTKSYAIVGLALPALALGFPIFDTLFSMTRRILERRSLFSPDRNHIHHLLVAKGLHQRHAVILMYVVTLAAVGIGMFMMVARDFGILIIFVCGLLPLILMFRYFGAIRFREAFTAFQKNMALNRETTTDQRGFEQMQLRLKEAKNFAQWWKAIRRAARELGFSQLVIVLENRDQTWRKLKWRLPSREVAGQPMLTMTFPVLQRRAGKEGQGFISVPVVEKLEQIGRRTMLFARLLDECGLYAFQRPLPGVRTNPQTPDLSQSSP